MFSALTGWSVRGKTAIANTTPNTPTPAATLSQEDYSPPEFNIDDYRPLKVRCIGAGFSGIICALRFRQKIPNLDFKIYEKQAGVGGTWCANKYPGVACDVPSHCYQFSFEDHSQWSKFYSNGDEIQDNIERVVDKYKIREYIQLEHELTYAKWDETSGKWTIHVRHGGKEFEEICDILVLGVGSLCRWKWPNIEGLNDFKGLLAHTADYHIDNKDVEGKRIGVIGNGSSGIQTVAALHPKAKTLVNYGRQKTWIAPDFGLTETKAQLGRQPDDTNQLHSEELERLQDPEFAKKFRHALEHDINVFHMLSIRDSEMQKQAKAQFEAEMKRHLVNKPELADKLVPDFSTTYETTPIKRITRTGVELTDGRHNDLDVLVLATGFDVSYHYPFDIVGRNNTKLNDRWSPLAEAYMSVAVDGFPNMFLMYGPGSGVNTNSTISMLESQAMYIVKCAAKLQRERLKAMAPKKEATADWMQHMRHYFPKTVYMDKCKAWYTSDDGTVVGLWPGSNLHAMNALANPRWEDYDYERIDSTKNRLYWLGDGQTMNEKNMTGDLTHYSPTTYHPGPVRCVGIRVIALLWYGR
ncbi:FAD/NAD-P-binding domain-containing protein [Irpex lacteus]|nr:FAD/NAD-P-binding domain-containing protein [Irpex lacteus]